MSHLGDLIVEHGPYPVGEPVPEAVRARFTGAMPPHGLNALRDELIELRAVRDRAQQPCPAGTSCWHLDADAPFAARISPLPAQEPPPVPTASPEGATDVSAGSPCQAETRSWDHFTPEQTDSYWIRCTLSGPHDEHEDEHTGLTWRSEAEA